MTTTRTAQADPLNSILRAGIKTAAGIFLLLTATGLSACGGDGVPDGTPELNVRTMTVAPAGVPGRHSFPGTVEGKARVTISTKLMGEISSMPFEEGDRVSRGDLLVSIRNGDLRARLAQVDAGRTEAAAALANVSANYERIRDLYSRKSATQKELDDITMAYEMARARVRSVDEMEKEINDMLRYADLTSPIDGAVVGKYAQVGDLASPGMPLMAVENTRDLRVTFPVPESEIGLVRGDSRIIVRVGALGRDAAFEGRVETINPSGNPASRQYEVKAGITAPAGAGVKSGMYATVLLDSEDRRAISVPGELLVRRGQLDGVFVLSAGGEALLRWVRTGKRFTDGTVEILSGLSGGEEVIVAPVAELRDGMAVGVAR